MAPSTKEEKKPDKTPGSSATKSIEHWAEKNGTSIFIMAGMKRRQRWGTGRCVTEKEFRAAAKDFSEGKTNAGRVKPRGGK